MKCHDIQLMITGFIEKRLTDQQLEDFIDHIGSCQDCYDELEVYYMITTGLMQLDENHTGTLDLKKNLQDFIKEQRRGLYTRKRSIVRKRRLSAAMIGLLLIFIVFLGQIFMTSEEGIYSLDDFRTAAVTAVEKYLPGHKEAPEPVTETIDPVKCRMNFESKHPLIPSYFSDLGPLEPEHRSILEKDR